MDVYTRWIDTVGEVYGMRCSVAPQFLENGTGRCMLTATWRAVLQFSVGGVTAMAAGGCPFVFFAERPDGASSNTRKMVHTMGALEDVPNVFLVAGKCGAHQCHRCIQCIERQSAGDAHAVCVACSHPSHMLAMQRSLGAGSFDIKPHRRNVFGNAIRRACFARSTGDLS